MEGESAGRKSPSICRIKGGISVTIRPFLLTLVVKLPRFDARPAYPAGFDYFRRESLPVTKKEIVRRISDRADLTQLKTKEIVQWTFDAIIDTLIHDGRIELRNFGVFEVRRRKARRARNPRTNDRVDVPEKNVVVFQPGKEMEERVRNDAKVYEPKRKKPKGNAAPSAAPTPAPAANSKAKPAPKPKGQPKPAKPKQPTAPPSPAGDSNSTSPLDHEMVGGMPATAGSTMG